MQKVAEEMTGNIPTVSRKRPNDDAFAPNNTDTTPVTKQRLACALSKCKNSTTDSC